VPPRLGPRAPEEDLGAVLGLPGGLADRLVAAVLATWTRRLVQYDDACDAARPQLHAALHGRTVVAVRTWLGRPDLAVDVHMTAPHAAPALTTVDADHVRAELPFAWLSTVWARGLTTLMGRFCLDAATRDGRDWTLLTVDPAFASVSRIRLQL